MASTPIAAQSNAVVGSLGELTDGTAPKTSKSDFANNVARFFESRKVKVAKNPPPPPARFIKATTENTAVSAKTGPKMSSTGSGSLYDDAWDISLSRFGLQTAAVNQQQRMQGGRGPPDGAAACESACSAASSSSSKIGATDSSPLSDSAAGGAVKTSAQPVSVTISTFTSSTTKPADPSTSSPQVSLSSNRGVVPPTETDSAVGTATPTPNNSNWFPPPPPTPLHLSLPADEASDGQGKRYHEHCRSFEVDDDQGTTKRDSGDAITLPPLLPPPPPQESVSTTGGGRASVASFLLNLPPPPPVSDLPTAEASPPPAIPPRDPKTSVTTPPEPPMTDLDGQAVVPEASSHNKQEENPDRTKVKQRHSKSGIDGRSVVPWERVAPPTSAAVDFSGSLPQWVPPQHSEAAGLHHRTSRLIGHRTANSKSSCEDQGSEGNDARPLSLAVSRRSQSHHRGRRLTARSFGDDSLDAVEAPNKDGSSGRRAVRMNSDSSGMAKARTLVNPGDVWTAAVNCDDYDSAGRFVRMGCDVRQHPIARSNAQRQHPPGTNQRKTMASTSVTNPDMTQSLIDWPGCDDASSTPSDSRHHQQQRICRRMKAVHLTDSGLVLSPQDAASLPVYHHGRRVFFSKAISPGDVPPGGGYFFQTQVSCPPHLGGKMSADEAVWTDGRVFEYQTAPAHAYAGQTYMLWPQHQLVSGQRRRRQNHHHHPTQSIIVPAADKTNFPMDKRSTSTKVNVPHNERPQVLVTGRSRGKRAADLAALVSLPVEEQPWFHGRLPRAEAESLLRSAPPGSFLVRTSETSKAAFSLSIRRDRDFLHMKISYDPKSEAFILGEYSQPYPTVPIMVHHYTRNLLPVRGTKPVLLKYPLCRTIGPFTLQSP